MKRLVAVTACPTGIAHTFMSLPSIASIKAQLRNTSLVRLKAFAKKALASQSAMEVRALDLPA